MGAPTWPPTPGEAHKATLDEYGDMAREVLDGVDDDDDAAEDALLARFLFTPPKRQIVAGEDNGTPLDVLHRSLHGWLRMVVGAEPAVRFPVDFELAWSDPASTDGHTVYLPRAVPSPPQAAEDALLYRCMALVQVGLVGLGFVDNRTFLSEIHRDWVLRSCYHLLATRYVMRFWSERWPGIARDFRGVCFLDKAGTMRVNVMVVPSRGMPQAFLPLYRGLVDFLEDSASGGSAERSDSGPAIAAIRAVDAVADPRGAPLVCLGQAQKLREHFKRERLGPPPLPYFAGILRPEWLLHDVRADLAAADEWKRGQLPLRQLIAKVKRTGASGVLPSALASRLRARSDLPPRFDGLEAAATSQVEPRPAGDGSRLYDEWDDERGAYLVGHTRVAEVPGPGGPLESHQRIVDANAAQVREIRRRFEALKLEQRWLHGQRDGEELDLDRAIAAMVDIRSGFTPRVDWHMRFQRQRQDVAILTMVDLSGSTAGNLIRLEEEALVLFAEGLRVLGLPHAFYGFSNRGPRECTFQRLKGWDEAYDDGVRKRISNLRSGGATRLGAFVRHATWSLSQRPQGRRILMVLSDGRPEDKGEYRGRQGIRDTAMAVQEAHRSHVHVHCISLDPMAREERGEGYLREIFGPGRYLILDRVDDLPARLPEVFRSLVS